MGRGDNEEARWGLFSVNRVGIGVPQACNWGMYPGESVSFPALRVAPRGFDAGRKSAPPLCIRRQIQSEFLAAFRFLLLAPPRHTSVF